MAINNVKSNTLTQALIRTMNDKKSNMRSGFREELGLDFGLRSTFRDGTHSSLPMSEANRKEVDVVIYDTDDEISGLIEVKASVYETLQPSQQDGGEYQKLSKKLKVPLYYFIPEGYAHKESIPSNARIIEWPEVYEVARNYNDEFADSIYSNVENLQAKSLNKDAIFLGGMLYSEEANKEALRKIFNLFIKTVKQDDAALFDNVKWNSRGNAVFSGIQKGKEWLTIEYQFGGNNDFLCHYVDSKNDDWHNLEINFENCPNDYDKTWYLINEVLPQYESILGKREFKKFFKTHDECKEEFLKDFLKECSSEYRWTVYQQVFDNELNPVLYEELEQSKYKITKNKYQITMVDFDDSWPGIYVEGSDWENFEIGFEFDKNKNDPVLYSGIHYINDSGEGIPVAKLKKLKNCLDGYSSTNWWAARKRFGENKLKFTPEVIFNIYKEPEDLAKKLRIEIEIIFKAIKDCGVI